MTYDLSTASTFSVVSTLTNFTNISQVESALQVQPSGFSMWTPLISSKHWQTKFTGWEHWATQVELWPDSKQFELNWCSKSLGTLQAFSVQSLTNYFLTLGGINFGRKWPHLQLLSLMVSKIDVNGHQGLTPYMKPLVIKITLCAIRTYSWTSNTKFSRNWCQNRLSKKAIC